MTKLSFEAYLDHLRSESARFREVLTSADPAARVPACPDWNAADLLWHLTGVHDFWGWIVTNRPSGPDSYEEPERPSSHADLLSLFDERSAALAEALEAADPADEAWTWSTDHTVGFTYRRQAHEALIHRLDAEQAAGDVTEMDARLAADGVRETLDVMLGGLPTWGTFTPGEGTVRVDCIDTDQHVWVRLGRFTGTDPDDDKRYDEDDLSVTDDPGTEPDLVVSGTSADLDAWLWHRADDREITVAGDSATHDLFSSLASQQLN